MIRTLAPLVHKQWGWFSVGRFDPRGEKTALVRLVPQVLVQIRISDFFQGLDVIDRHQVAVQIHELNPAL